MICGDEAARFAVGALAARETGAKGCARGAKGCGARSQNARSFPVRADKASLLRNTTQHRRVPGLAGARVALEWMPVHVSVLIPPLVVLVLRSS
jgi:hypothetical protein